MIKKLVVFFSSFLMIANTTIAQTKDEKAIATAVESLRKAMIDGDKATLEKLASEKLSYGHSSGLVENKTEFVDKIATGKSDFVTIELSEQTISVSGKTAVVRHLFNATTNDGGKPGAVKIKILLVWQKEKGGWKLLARQAVRLT
jgi:ketosteroid isomerase-like protein